MLVFSSFCFSLGFCFLLLWLQQNQQNNTKKKETPPLKLVFFSRVLGHLGVPKTKSKKEHSSKICLCFSLILSLHLYFFCLSSLISLIFLVLLPSFNFCCVGSIQLGQSNKRREKKARGDKGQEQNKQGKDNKRRRDKTEQVRRTRRNNKKV